MVVGATCHLYYIYIIYILYGVTPLIRLLWSAMPLLQKCRTKTGLFWKGALEKEVSFWKRPSKGLGAICRCHLICVIWRSHVCDMTYSYVWHDWFICVAWSIHMCDRTHSHVWRDAFIWVTWLIQMCDSTHSYVWHHSFHISKKLQAIAMQESLQTHLQQTATCHNTETHCSTLCEQFLILRFKEMAGYCYAGNTANIPQHTSTLRNTDFNTPQHRNTRQHTLRTVSHATFTKNGRLLLCRKLFANIFSVRCLCVV